MPLHDLPYPATYRLQLHAGFTFDDAAEQVDYIAALGVTHLYLSPILHATAGSHHGYDVVDHSRVSADLGGREGLVRLVQVAREHGLGVLVDVVPNHMAFAPTQNAQLWDVLAKGQASAYAHWFDIDWDAEDGRLVVPVLGGPTQSALDAGEIVIEGDRLRYFDHEFPIADGTGEGTPAEVLARQHYLLLDWREVDRLNYRRFFDVTGLIAVRVELEDVFVATHDTLLALHRDGLVDGFRIDHPDGLADPEGYLARLADALGPAVPVYVEKILEGHETLPDTWATTGTTGYDAARAVAHAFVEPDTIAAWDEAWAATGGEQSFEAEVDRAKREVVERMLGAEVARLERGLDSRGSTTTMRPALTEVLVAADRYRYYVRPGEPPTREVAAGIAQMATRAREAAPDEAEQITTLVDLLAGDEQFATRLQQTWGPVMAKGIEDTAGYRWGRMVALNEVGSDPTPELGHSPGLEEWGRHQAAHWPLGMTTLSTHDTKRSEDVRARLLAISSDAEGWRDCSQAAREAAGDLDLPTAHFVWQTVIGLGGLDTLDQQVVDRLHAYLTKAVREAKLHTIWTDPDEDYEARVHAFADVCWEPGPLKDTLDAVVARNEERVRRVTLGQKLLQLMLPGVPDLYQGNEILDYSLVDPDNRRPVDFGVRRARLAALDDGEAPRDLDAEKLLVVRRALDVRREHGGSMRGDFTVVELPDGLVGFRTGDVLVLATRASGADPDGRFSLPEGGWRSAFDGRVYRNTATVADLVGEFPVALLFLDQAHEEGNR